MRTSPALCLAAIAGLTFTSNHAAAQPAQRAAFVANNGNAEGSVTSFTFSPSGEPQFVAKFITAGCDSSTAPPILNVSDFVCFLNKYAAGDSYANCDSSTLPPVLNVNDFVCFNTQFAVGCL